MRGQAWRRASLALGLTLFVAGAAILGLGLYSYLHGGGSDSAGEPSPYLLAGYNGDEGIYDRPIAHTNAPPATDAPPAPAPPSSPSAPPIARDVRYRMIAESIGVDAPVVTFGLDGNGVPQVPLNGGDIAWYNFTAEPGTGSNAVFAGHVNWNRAVAVFGRIKNLAAGDTIRLVAKDGTELVYSVSDNFLVDPSDPVSLQVMAPTPTDTITLITCGGTWVPDRSERFGGDYTNRVIVRATLVSINTVAAAGSTASGG
ncbi:MAG TPA: class F sortase [Dehalococcoidia bacterium]|nr:class F sortase [Dehalococcoidia bacterium]